MKKIILINILLSVLAVASYAQQTLSFQILNHEDQPLIGATYQYDSQNGVSDNEGFIKVEYQSGSKMTCSYIGYGSWTLTDEELLQADKNGFIRRSIQEEQLLPVTVIALRPKMSEKEIVEFSYKEKMAYDGGELLTQSAAISGIRKSGSYGTDPVMRGFKYDQINIVLNGTQSATAACPNRMDPPSSQMAPNMIDRVEILKGPFAMRYGGGLGATINFVTESARFDNSGLSGRLSGRYDFNGNAVRTEAMAGWKGSTYEVALLGSFSGGNDYTDGGGNTIQSDFNRNSLGIQSAFKITNNQVVDISAFHNWAKDVDFPSLPMDLRKDQTTMINASHQFDINNENLKTWKTTAFVSKVDHLMDNLLKPLDPRMMNARTDAKTLNFGARTEGTWKWNRNTLYLGADYKREEAEGIRTREVLLGMMAGKIIEDNAWQHGRITKSGLFAEYTIRKNNWNFVGAGRLEVNNAEVLDSDTYFAEQYEDLSSNQFNPSISLGAIKNINENISLGAWIARAQRSASLTERYINRFPVGSDPYEVLGNPNLDPEVNNQVELTFEYKAKKALLTVNVFSSWMQNYITSFIDSDLTPVMMNRPGVRRFTNVDDAFKTGFELGMTSDFTSWLCQKADIAYTYAHNTTLDEPLPEIAPLDIRYKLCAHTLGGKLHGQAGIRYVAAQDRVSTEFGEQTSTDFTTIDLEVSYQIFNKGKITFGIDNLLDAQYAEHLSRATLGANAGLLNAPGRNIYTSFNITF